MSDDYQPDRAAVITSRIILAVQLGLALLLAAAVIALIRRPPTSADQPTAPTTQEISTP